MEDGSWSTVDSVWRWEMPNSFALRAHCNRREYEINLVNVETRRLIVSPATEKNGLTELVYPPSTFVSHTPNPS